jgi:hypothetical protein
MKKLFTAALFFCVLCGIFSQEYGRGAIIDQEHYEGLPRKALQISRAYTTLPSSMSLKNYAPVPGNQGGYGTCTGWASAYATRTIAESIALRRTDKTLINNNVFSPVFVYKSVSTDPQCSTGIRIEDALDLMQRVGAPKMTPLERIMDFLKTPLSLFTSERKYTIAGYSTLYSSYMTGADISRVQLVKKSLVEEKPVVIAIVCPDSFFQVKEVWRPTETPNVSTSAHALCVVGYDDAKYGGAFEIQNSWGTSWGNAGYTWIPYDTFSLFAWQAFEMIDNLATYGKLSEYSGKVQIALRNSDDGMPVTFQNGYYQTVNEYPSGARFRYLLGNDNPAYVLHPTLQAIKPP